MVNDSPVSLHLVITNIQKSNNIQRLLLTAAAFGCKSVLVVGQGGFDFGPTTISMPALPPPSTSTTTQTATTTTSTSSTHAQDDTPRDVPLNVVKDAGTTTKDSSRKGSHVPRVLTTLLQDGGMSIRRFDRWQSCVAYLEQYHLSLVGVEIHPSALTMEEFLQQLQNQQQQQDSPTGIAFLMGNEGSGIHPKHMASCNCFVRLPQYGVGTASFNVYVAASMVLQRVHQWQREQEQDHPDLHTRRIQH